MVINLNYSDEENPLSLKSDFILSLCELIAGGKDSLKPVEKTLIDRCVRMDYQKGLQGLLVNYHFTFPVIKRQIIWIM